MVDVAINLDSQHGGVFFAGELVSGTIEVNLAQPTKFRGISFVVYGRAKCQWTETERRTVGHGDDRRTEDHDINYEGKTVYISNKMLLFGNSGGEITELPSGLHKYNFQFPLPPLIPASFEGTYGNIRYRVEAELNVPWSFDKQYKLQFTVVRKDELNSQPELKLPIQLEEITRFCCCCCQSDPLMMTVTLPFGGFVPGQDIPIKINYINKSDVSIDQTELSLKQITNFISSSPCQSTKLEENKVMEKQEGGVLEFENRNIETLLTLPNNLPASNGMMCNVVKISYELKIVARTSGCHLDIELTTSIVIGSDPLIMDASAVQPTFSGSLVRPPIVFQPVQPYTDESQQPNNGAAPPGYVTSYEPPSSDKPPSFEEAVSMNAVPRVTSGTVATSETVPPGWNLPTGQMPMPMPSSGPASIPPYPTGPSVMPPYPVTTPLLHPSAPYPVSEEND